MIKRISLENFMAHAATSLELSPGVTVIAGPNNIGKSAIVEALRHLLYNPAPKQVIRHGARETVVRLELDSGDSITWRRTDNRAAYILEQPGQPPVPYYKFGREVPADIRSLLRLEQVVTDTGRAIDIHVGNQRDPIFLLDEPGSHAAGFFAASSEADYLLKMQQALKRRREEASREQTRLQAELAELAAGLAHLAPLADLDLRLQEAEALYDVIAATVRRLPLWQDLHRDLAETTARLQGAQAVAGVLAGLQSPPALVATAGLAQLLAALEDTSRQMAQETLRQEVLAQVWQPPALAETAALAETVQASQDLQEELAVAHAQKGVLAALQQPPAALSTRELTAAMAALAAYEQQWQGETERLAALTALQPPPALVAIGTLPRLLQELAAIQEDLAHGQQRQQLLAQAAPPPDLFDLQPLASLTTELAERHAARQQQARRLDLLQDLSTPPALLQVTALQEALAQLSQRAADLAQEQQQHQRLSQELAQLRDRIQAYLQEVGACPLCGSPLDLGHFLEEAHA